DEPEESRKAGDHGENEEPDRAPEDQNGPNQAASYERISERQEKKRGDTDIEPVNAHELGRRRPGPGHDAKSVDQRAEHRRVANRGGYPRILEPDSRRVVRPEGEHGNQRGDEHGREWEQAIFPGES